MATLTGKTPAATYRDLLQVSNSNAGVDTTTRNVSDGEATASALGLSTTVVSVTGHLELDNGSSGAGEIRWLEDSDNGTNYLSMKAPAAVTTTTTWILPDGDGSSGEVLSTDGAGTLSWTAAGGADTFATIQVDGVTQSTNAPTLDFDGTDFTLTESPADTFDITIQAERIQDIAGAMTTGNTETNITVTYQDADGTIDFEVPNASDTVVGAVELATIAETNTGTSTTLAVTPDGLDGWTGSAQVTTLGTIATGTWEGTTVAVDQGGTGQTTYTNGQLLIGNTTGNTLTKATITGGTNLTVTNGTGSITLDVDDAFLANTGDVGTGVYDFGGATSFEIPNSATPTVNAAGEIAIDTSVASYDGLIKYYDGTTEMAVVAVPVSDLTTTDNDVVAYSTANSGFNMEAQSGAGGTNDEGKTIALGMILR